MSRLFSNKSAPYILIAFTLLIIYAVLGRLTPQRVGDGAEYYALFYAWTDTLRPWMTARSFDSYELLVTQSNIIGLVPREWLEHVFPSLRLGDTADFNHFWFYSFLAFFSAKLLTIVGLPGGAHQGFLALHFLLLLGTAMTSFYLFKWRGLFAVLLMTIASPMLWYFDKVHTELFTYCTVLMAIMFAIRKKYLATSFMLAIASTQNPSFSIIAFLPFIYRFVVFRKNNFTLLEVTLAIGTALIVIVHPTYYFMRFGVPTPQLLAGGASLGGNLSTFYIWLIDPDLGLLPNWPIGVFFTLAASVIFILGKKKDFFTIDKFLMLFLVCFFIVNFYAHASTTNLNSGATPGVARYSLWYLPAFFPVVYYVIRNYPRNKYFVILSVFGLIILTVLSFILNNPKKHEDYTTPTRFSSLIQTHASFLYDPPQEVFAERYSGLGEAIRVTNPRGILGPDCEKILIYPGEGRTNVTSASGCFVNFSKLQNVATALATGSREKEAFYVHLDKKTFSEIFVSLKPGEYLVGQSKEGNQILRSGWSTPEAWGVWSDGRVSKISLPCNPAQFYFNQDEIYIELHLQPFGSRNISIDHNGLIVYEGSINESSIVNFTADVERCRKNSIDFSINIANPKSPFELGQSADTRKLGVGLTKFVIK